jgi:hypothetical protein
MKQPNSSHFHAGKAARAAGKPCIFSDGRTSPTSRQEWYEGWNHQNNLMCPPPAAGEVEQTACFLRSLSQSIKEGGEA